MKTGKVFALCLTALFCPQVDLTMRRTLTPLLVLLVSTLSIAQTQPTLAALTDEVALAAHSEDVEMDASKLLSHSEGFTDSSFTHQLLMTLNAEQLLEFETDCPRTLQYSISNVEGIILRKGKFYQQGMVNIGSLRPGSYAVYFFAGKRIVRAFMIDRRQTAM